MGFPALIPIALVQNATFGPNVYGFSTADTTVPPQLINATPLPMGGTLVAKIYSQQDLNSTSLLDFSGGLSIGSPTIIMGAPATPLTITITASQTETLPVGELYYDILMIYGGVNLYLMSGPCVVTATVSR